MPELHAGLVKAMLQRLFWLIYLPRHISLLDKAWPDDIPEVKVAFTIRTDQAVLTVFFSANYIASSVPTRDGMLGNVADRDAGSARSGSRLAR